ncbi:MAG: allantoicase [Candidatus Acidiferrales bacterium]
MNEFHRLVDLASERLGGRVLAANDEFFAPKENLLKPAKPVFIEGKYTDRGKWMDGWETRRRRTPGFDWCIIRLGLPGVIRGVVVDTSFFTGNFPSHFSLEACDLGKPPNTGERRQLTSSKVNWIEAISKTALHGDAQNSFSVGNAGRFTHLRLKIYPDGGVSRLRVHGEVVPDSRLAKRRDIDLVAIESGGSIVASSDQFYSEPLNLLMPGRGNDMSDGWETRRRRGPGHDWAVLKLGVPGKIRRIQVDTAHFKGNFPESCSLEACYLGRNPIENSAMESEAWNEVLSRAPLQANKIHNFRKIRDVGTVSHVRFNIYPDGGVSRLRIFGGPARLEDQLKGLDRINRLPAEALRKSLLDCCGSIAWVNQFLAQRPFSHEESMFHDADRIWAQLDRKEWLRAFRHHPPIGSKRAKAKQSRAAQEWSEGEQSTAKKSAPETLAVLAAANQAYHAAFGHVFLICATNKSADEILKSLQERLQNSPDVELHVAADEHQKIMRLRLEKLLKS